MHIYDVPSESVPNKTELRLRFEFKNEESIADVGLVYNLAKSLCSFMSFRENVGFDSIKLYQRNQNNERNLDYYADCFIRNDCLPLTSKDNMKCILFEQLHPYINNLFDVILNSTEKNHSYMMNFYPANDKTVYSMTDERIKNICSSLECELSFIKDINPSEEERLSELIKQVKEIIKTHRKTENKLENGTYDMIFSSLSHWSMPNADKICEMFINVLYVTPIRLNSI